MNEVRLIDANELRKCAIPCVIHNGALTDMCVPLYQIDNAPTIEITEKQAILLLINSGWLVNHNKELREKWERPKGKWELIKDKGNNIHAECPFCKFQIKCIAYNYSIWEVKQFIKNSDFEFEFPNFCENCGAELGGVVE